MGNKRIIAVRSEIDRIAEDQGSRNRLWWERMPMTYVAWDAEDRLPKKGSDYREIERYLLAKSPFLRNYFEANEFEGLAVLDLGCGSGVLSCLLARKGARVTAADITEQSVSLACENARSQDLPLHVVRTDAEIMGFADRVFDFVLSWGVIHHSPDTEQALREIARIMKPGGRGLIMVYHKSSLVYYLRGLYWLIWRGKLWRGYNLETVQNFCVDGYYHRHFRRNELKTALTAAGLRPVHVRATQQDEPLLPFVPARLDDAMKARFGWYLVAEIEREGE